jgi:glucose uptake protein GlcU
MVSLRQVFSIFDILGGILLLSSTKFNKFVGIIMIIVGVTLLIANAKGALLDQTTIGE